MRGRLYLLLFLNSLGLAENNPGYAISCTWKKVKTKYPCYHDNNTTNKTLLDLVLLIKLDLDLGYNGR